MVAATLDEMGRRSTGNSAIFILLLNIAVHEDYGDILIFETVLQLSRIAIQTSRRIFLGTSHSLYSLFRALYFLPLPSNFSHPSAPLTHSLCWTLRYLVHTFVPSARQEQEERQPQSYRSVGERQRQREREREEEEEERRG